MATPADPPYRPRSSRVAIAVRVNPAWLDQLAERTGTNRSLALRAALAVASRHEPDVLRILTEQAL